MTCNAAGELMWGRTYTNIYDGEGRGGRRHADERFTIQKSKIVLQPLDLTLSSKAI